MKEKEERIYSGGPPLADTQELLRDVELPEGEGFDLETILAEYGGGSARSGEDPVPQASGSVPEEIPPEEMPPPPAAPLLPDDSGLEGISPQAMFGLKEETPPSPPVPEGEEAPETPPAADAPQEPEEVPAVSMEDIVASTVDAVKEEESRRQAKWRKKWEKEQKKRSRSQKRREPKARRPLPPVENEPLPAELAAGHRRRYFQCRRALLMALPAAAVLWLPWVLARFGVALPFFSRSTDNAALCVLAPQALVCALGWPVFRAALEDLREGACTEHFLTALANVVTILDAVTLLLLPQRADTAPLGGVAAMVLLFNLWGLKNWHRGMWETMRTAALGRPGYVADICESGVAKARGNLEGFTTRAAMEDTSSQWQRLLSPLLVVASLVFAVLSSVGQGRGQDLLWCWSVILCAACSVAFPLAYRVPFGRLAARLARSGAAVAGQYGAAVLASSRQLVVTDQDLFPPGTAALSGLKLYGEERGRAISYAATLAIPAGGVSGRLFDELCRGERIALQQLEHFHIHEDGGLGGMIHGETVLLGTPIFMRHKAVRLPATMPAKTCVCLAVDGALTAVFAIKYNTSDLVESALRALGRNGLRLTLAVRDGNITPKLLKTRFGTDGGACCPEISERLALSDPQRETEGPNGLLYREGLYPFVDLVSGSRRLCQTVHVGNLLAVLSAVGGALLGFYLTFAGSYAVLTPLGLATYLLLWALPMVPLLWGVDKT